MMESVTSLCQRCVGLAPNGSEKFDLTEQNRSLCRGEKGDRNSVILWFFVLSQCHTPEEETLKGYHLLPLSRMLRASLMGACSKSRAKLGR